MPDWVEAAHLDSTHLYHLQLKSVNAHFRELSESKLWTVHSIGELLVILAWYTGCCRGRCRRYTAHPTQLSHCLLAPIEGSISQGPMCGEGQPVQHLNRLQRCRRLCKPQ